jgi:hypothetical protein
MRHVSILGNDFKALNGLGVAHNIVEIDGAVLFYPARSVSCNDYGIRASTYQGNS